MTQKALEIQNKTDSYLLEPEAWGYSLYDLGAICCYRLGLYEKSFTYARIALEMAPENERLKTNLQRIAQKLGEQSRGEFHEAFI
jgi:tetratricopeptide (TPR) repeat protein